jgi:hypothetical protein
VTIANIELVAGRKNTKRETQNKMGNEIGKSDEAEERDT